LERPCPECGFVADTVAFGDLPRLIRANADRWPALLTGPDVTVRPRADRWSALEYACHVRDVFRIALHRLDLMLTEDDPVFADWDQDATALEQRYDLQDPAVVATDLLAAGGELADAFAEVEPDQYARMGQRSDGAVFTIESFGKYILHDPT